MGPLLINTKRISAEYGNSRISSQKLCFTNANKCANLAKYCDAAPLW